MGYNDHVRVLLVVFGGPAFENTFRSVSLQMSPSLRVSGRVLT